MKDKDFCQRIHISRVTRRVCKWDGPKWSPTIFVIINA
jgi:hypothetical protein